MKKIILLITICLMSFISFAQEKSIGKTITDNVSESVSNVYKDGTSAVSTVYNDSKELLKVAYDDVKSTVNVIAPKIEKAVTDLAKGLAVGAEELFKVLTLQQVVNSIVYSLVLIIFLFSFFSAMKKINKFVWTKKSPDIADKQRIGVPGLAIFIYLTIATITGILFLTNITAFVMGYVNPKYGAIMEILTYAEKFVK